MSIRTAAFGPFVFVSFLTVSLAAQVPEELKTIVFGDTKRETIKVTVNKLDFEGLAAFSEFPYLMWPIDDKNAEAIPHDRDKLKDWLNASAETLGFAGFTAEFEANTEWHSNEVWQYKLTRHDLPLHDARIEIHWQDKRFLGIVNHTPSPIASIEDPPAIDPEQEWVYYAIRNAEGAHTVTPALVTRTRRANNTLVQIAAKGVSLANIVTASGANQFEWIDPSLAFFKEYNVPQGTFPDQISVDEDGYVWFSQPQNNWLTRFDPATATFQFNSTTGGSGPDGMIVGTQGRVWSGMYFSGSLGMWDSVAQVYKDYPAPYANAAMAIPVETTDGRIWVTDHARNRISEFDPVNEVWLQSLVMPTASCWVVQGYEDRDNGQLYLTEYSANQLGKIAVGGSQITDIITPGGGPAFCVYSDGKVYYSRWNEAGIGAYDVNTQQITEYQFPIGSEVGGPLWISPTGKIVTGTRNLGYIMVFNPGNETFSAYQIPTQSPGLKDGMTVAQNGVIWFTETGANKIAKLTLMPLVPKSAIEK